MARIFKRGKKWYVDYRVNGRRIWKSVGTRKELAEDYLKDLEGKRVRGELMDIREVKTANFDDFCVKYLEVYGQNKAESTRARDDVTVNKHLIPFFGLRPLKHITTADIEEYKAQRRTTRRKDRVLADGTVVKGKRIARTTINRELGLLKSLLARAVEWGYLKESPANAVKKFKEEVHEPRSLQPHEGRALMETSQGQMKGFVVTALNTGMRRGELFALKWSDVSFESEEIRVRKTKGKRFRVIPMNDLLLETLRKHPRSSKGPHVFCNADGSAWCDVRASYKSTLKAAKLPTNLTFHDLRHTFVSNLVMAGV